MLIGLIVLVGCKTQQTAVRQSEAPAHQEGVEVIEITAEQLENTAPAKSGKKIAESACVRCHPLPPYTNFTKEEWEPILRRMQPKAKVSDAELADLRFYIHTQLSK